MRTPNFSRACYIAFLLAVGASACSGELLSPATPTAISFSPGALTLRVGANQQVIPSALFNNQPISSSQLQFRWSSSAQQVATVDNTGRITANGRGSTQIFAQLSDISTASIVSSPLSVTVVGVSSVAIAPSTVAIEVGRTAALVATVQADFGVTPLPVAWASNDLSKVTVSATGQITALSPGTAVVTATCEGRSSSALITIVPPSVASILLTPASSTIEAGASVVMTATPRDGSGTVLTGRAISWQSSNAAVAIVSASGTVTGVTSGVTLVTASSEGRSASAQITVTSTPGLTTLNVQPSNVSLTTGATQQLTTVVLGPSASSATLSYLSSAPLIATVSTTGVVTAVSAGTAVVGVTASSLQAGAFSASSITSLVPVTVTPNTSVASITLTPTSSTVEAGALVVITATLRDGSGRVLTGRTVQWQSSNPAVATIGASGTVAGVTPGVTVVTASAEGRSASAQITVTPALVASITLTPQVASLAVGGSAVLTATPRDARGGVLTERTVQWLSANPAVATISASGTVTGVAPGSTSVSATISGVTAFATITVTSTACGAVTPYVYGTTVSSLLGASGACTYSGALAQPGVWRLSLTSSTFAPFLSFAPSNGNGFGWVSAVPGTVTFELLTGAGALGTSITRAANTSGSGAFSLSSAAVVSDTASCGSLAAATVGASAQRQLNARDCVDATNRYRDFYWVSLSAGSVITVTMRSTAFDAFLEVWAAEATVRSASDDDSGGGNDSRLTFTAPASGFYLIRCTTFSAGEIGLYTLTIN
jgi:uncharacterized protein YjdB